MIARGFRSFFAGARDLLTGIALWFSRPKLMLLGADITEHGALVLLVEPEHARPAAHV